MKTAFLIPYRGTPSDKSRLRKDLANDIVDDLLPKMAQNVINQISEIKEQKSIYLLTKNREITFLGDFEIIIDEGKNLNETISKAVEQINEELIMVIMADLPLITKKPIIKALKALKNEKKIVIFPSADQGTSLLGFHRKLNIEFVFGHKSACRYKKQFEKKNYNFTQFRYVSEYKDIDTFKDIITLIKNESVPEWIKNIIPESEKNARKNR